MLKASLPLPRLLLLFSLLSIAIIGNAQKATSSTKKILVNNIAFETSEDEIHQLFSGYGKIINIDWMIDRDTGRFKGFCFIEMTSDGADRAIAALNRAEFRGRPLIVSETRPKEKRE